jgi:ring-1,2-phenylacetyl-CoA epoxidase subunit PaaD
MADIVLVPELLASRRSRRNNSDCPELWAAIETISDPEIPVISIWDLGILHDVQRQGGTVVVTITPTYSGCPAMDEIARDIRELISKQFGLEAVVKISLTPAWSTDLISPEGKTNLRNYGIAPPRERAAANQPVACPQCGSEDTECISEFGSTACKALYKCRSCSEPFDYFKCI